MPNKKNSFHLLIIHRTYKVFNSLDHINVMLTFKMGWFRQCIFYNCKKYILDETNMYRLEMSQAITPPKHNSICNELWFMSVNNFSLYMKLKLYWWCCWIGWQVNVSKSPKNLCFGEECMTSLRTSAREANSFETGCQSVSVLPGFPWVTFLST